MGVEEEEEAEEEQEKELEGQLAAHALPWTPPLISAGYLTLVLQQTECKTPKSDT